MSFLGRRARTPPPLLDQAEDREWHRGEAVSVVLQRDVSLQKPDPEPESRLKNRSYRFGKRTVVKTGSLPANSRMQTGGGAFISVEMRIVIWLGTLRISIPKPKLRRHRLKRLNRRHR